MKHVLSPGAHPAQSGGSFADVIPRLSGDADLLFNSIAGSLPSASCDP